MGSGDPPGLQNRRAAGLPVAGAFDSHTLPPTFSIGCGAVETYHTAISALNTAHRDKNVISA